MKLACKWMNLEKTHPEQSNPDPETQTCYVHIYKSIVAVI